MGTNEAASVTDDRSRVVALRGWLKERGDPRGDSPNLAARMQRIGPEWPKKERLSPKVVYMEILEREAEKKKCASTAGGVRIVRSAAERRFSFTSLPVQSFIPRACRWMIDFTDTPVECLETSSISALAAAVGGNVLIPNAGGPNPLRTNLYQVIIGKSGDRKSTALNSMGRVLSLTEDRMRERGMDRPLLLPDDFSVAGLKDELALRQELRGKPWGIIIHDELSEIIESAGTKYNLDLIKVLTRLYDTPPRLEKRRGDRSNRARIEWPVVSILTASTGTWLHEVIHRSHVGGGFCGRFLFVEVEQVSEQAWQRNADESILGELAGLLLRFALIDQEVFAEFDQRAKRWYENWFASYQDNYTRAPENADVAALFKRGDTYSKKLAAVFALNGLTQDPDKLDWHLKHRVYEVRAEHLKTATDYVLDRMEDATRLSLGRPDLFRLRENCETVFRLLKRRRSLSSSDMSKLLKRHDGWKMGRMYLLEQGVVRSVPTKRGARYEVADPNWSWRG